jgi:hypothetical protein
MKFNSNVRLLESRIIHDAYSYPGFQSLGSLDNMSASWTTQCLILLGVSEKNDFVALSLVLESEQRI